MNAKRAFRALPLIASALAISVGGAVLVGWALNIGMLKSVLPGWVAMKPNTAVAFILIGIALLLSRPQHPTRSARRSALRANVAQLAGAMAGTIGVLSLCEYAFGWNPGFDQWLFSESAGGVGTSHPGRMAPDAALCFALLAVARALIVKPRLSARTRLVAVTLAALVIALAVIETLSYFAPELRSAGWGGLTMMSLPTAVLFGPLGSALAVIAVERDAWASHGPGPDGEEMDRRSTRTLILIFAVLTAGIIAAGTFYYQSVARTLRLAAEQQLASIADLKVKQLVEWRRERLSDGRMLFDNPSFSAMVRRVVAQPADVDARREILEWLGKYSAAYGYEQVRLLDAQGVSRLLLPASRFPVSSATVRMTTEALRAGQVAFADFSWNESEQRVYLQVLVPIYDESRAHRPLGVIALRVDPHTFLYPFIQSWPVPSRTSETLLIRSDGDDVLYLNDLRFKADAALTLRAPKNRADLPAARAVLGQTGIMQGLDYRNVPVLAELRAVPDSPWYLVAKMDIAEAAAPIGALVWQVVTMVGILIFGVGASVGALTRQQRVRFYRAQGEASEALHASDARYRAIIESANDGVLTIDNNGNVVHWNRSATRIFGYTEDESIGHSVTALIPPRFRDAHVAGLTRVLSSSERRVIGTTVELTALHKDGHEFPISLSLAEWATAEGRYFSGVISDLTERAHAEADLRLRGAALEAAANPIVITDLRGTIVWANAAFTTATGYSLDEAVGKNPRELVNSGSHDQPFYRALWDTILAGNVWQGELTNRRKDGSLYPEEMTITPVKDAAGGITHFIAVKRDLTQDKEQNAKFLQAQKMESVGRLAAGVAHDFNNLLTVILSYATFIQEDLPQNDPHRDDVAQILSAGKSATDLTGRLLALSRRQEVELKELQLNAIASGMEIMLQRLIGESIALEVALAPDLLPIKADAGQIDQVIMNLVVNARDAMSGSGVLGITTTNVPRDAMPVELTGLPVSGDFVCLRISDTGSGMDEATRLRIFEPFFTTKELGKGTGLGLATVYGIVNASRGHVGVESQVGVGTTFSIYFPAAIVADPIAATRHATPTDLGGTETVLVVEDATPNRGAVCAVLRRNGYTVLEASNGAEALEAAAAHAHTIDLLLTDVVMPKMNGRQLVEQLRSLQPELRVLYMSGYTEDVLSEHGVLNSGDALLHKPFTPGPLATKVREVLDAP